MSRKGMAKNTEKIAAALGATRVIQVPDTGGGAFGAARLGHIVATLQARFVPGQNPDDLPPETAREILSLRFGDEDQARMRELSLKAQAGTLTASEQIEIDNYERVGYSLGILWSKARLSLKRAGLDAAHE